MSTAWVYEPGRELPSGDPPIGWPLSHVLADIRSEFGEPVPRGVAGELWLAGPSLTDGYIDQPGLNRTKFRTIEVGGEDVRFYRTGDWVRADATGALRFLGRTDNQIKLRGFRIEQAIA